MTNKNQLLRFTTAGSVDDGKSTLIGRLLYDSKSVLQDQLKAVENASKKKGEHTLDLAMFTDGLREEREQGITIDVAYRYFSTTKRKFIIADAPGHFQYTRNLVTAASTANAVILLIDATKGFVEQTKRHTFITSLLQIPHLVVCINKMDLVDYSEFVFNKIVGQVTSFCSKLLIKDIRFIPISALDGDNVVVRSRNTDWYQAAPLLHTLETLHISSDINKVDARLPIQTILNNSMSTENHLFSGRISSGIFRKGDSITVLPSGRTSSIKTITSSAAEVEEAYAPMSISVSLSDNLEVSRGEMIVRTNNQPEVTKDFEVMLCWLSANKATLQSNYIIRHTTNQEIGLIDEVIYKFDIDTLNRQTADKEISMNDIARVKMKLIEPIMVDPYRTNRSTGSIILVHCDTNETVAAGMVI